VRKNPSQDEAMTDAEIVDQAEGWAKRLTQSEARGPGDMENAWRRLESRYGVPWRTFWALRYRKPRDLTASVYHRLAAAYTAECERQMKLLRHEISITKLVAGPDHPAVVASEAALGALASKTPEAEDI
jgi:hypothetical protein